MSPLENLERNLSQNATVRNNQKHFVSLARAFHEDLTQEAAKNGIDSEKYKSILANTHCILDKSLPLLLDLIVLGHPSELYPWCTSSSTHMN